MNKGQSLTIRKFDYLLFHPINRAGFQADATATPLASFALIMAAEAVETLAATTFPPEISTSLFCFIIFILPTFSQQESGKSLMGLMGQAFV